MSSLGCWLNIWQMSWKILYISLTVFVMNTVCQLLLHSGTKETKIWKRESLTYCWACVGEHPKVQWHPLEAGASMSSANALTLDCQDAVAPINCFRKGVTAPATTISLVSGRGNFVTILYNCYIPVDNTRSSEKFQYPTISSILPFGTSPIFEAPNNFGDIPTEARTWLHVWHHTSPLGLEIIVSSCWWRSCSPAPCPDTTHYINTYPYTPDISHINRHVYL